MSFCTKCGAQLEEDAKFCTACGEKVEEITAVTTEEPIDTPKEDGEEEFEARTVGGSGEIKLCADGKYRWIYEFPMLKNPTILFTVWNVLGISSAIVALFMFFITLGDGFTEALKACLGCFGIMVGIFVVLGIIGYVITAAIYGWKYIVLFEMDDKEVSHIMMDKQFKKAEAIGWLTFMAGAATKNVGRMGQGLLVATKSSSTSVFKNVEKVIGLPKSNTIKVNQLLGKNQVYCDKRDYDFVWDHITSHCTNAKIIK